MQDNWLIKFQYQYSQSIEFHSYCEHPLSHINRCFNSQQDKALSWIYSEVKDIIFHKTN